jgi:hypothetical protein
VGARYTFANISLSTSLSKRPPNHRGHAYFSPIPVWIYTPKHIHLSTTPTHTHKVFFLLFVYIYMWNIFFFLRLSTTNICLPWLYDGCDIDLVFYHVSFKNKVIRLYNAIHPELSVIYPEPEFHFNVIKVISY